jgi:8-oxo-dGTP pyrophosphatase MutT (NUDIX family)
MENIIFESCPKNFYPHMEVSACYFKVKDKFLFLENSDNKEYAHTWSVPAGKINPGESPLNGVIRETFEETGIILKPSEIIPHKSVFLKYPKYDLVYHMFKVVLQDFPEKIILREREHKKFAWLTKEEVLKLPLMPAAKECFLSTLEPNSNIMEFNHAALALRQDKNLIYTAMSKHYFYYRMFVSKFVLERAAVPLNPFMIFDYFLLDTIDRNVIREANNNLVKKADEIWVFGPISNGVLAEIQIAKGLNKRVRFFKIEAPHKITEITRNEIIMENDVERWVSSI